MHYPYCRHLCNYCDFFRTKNLAEDRHVAFHEYLEKSLDLLDKFHQLSPLKTLYLGGGTPSLWGASGAKFIKRFELQKEAEVTLEVNPGSWTNDGIAAFKESGVNRFSIGVQTLNVDLQKYLDRVHSIDEAYETIEFFKGTNFSVDLMLGIPHSENKRDVIGELKELLKYHPTHLSLYILTVKSGYPYFNHLPSEEWIEKEYLEVSSYLEAQGFLHYEVSNFARPGFESKHNLKYWKNESVAAIGPSATGILREGDSAIRYKWDNGKPEYSVERLSQKELDLEDLYLKLRTNQGVDFKDDRLLKKWSEQGYLKSTSPLVLSARGFLLLDSIMNDLF